MSFPNPQAALPLPRRPNLEGYRNLAKELVKTCRSGDEQAVRQWAVQWLSALSKSPTARVTAKEVAAFVKCKDLSDAQSGIARCHGFESWMKFTRYLTGLTGSTPTARFEAAADAIVNGNLAKLKRLLRNDPKLVRATSAREHGAALIHYTAANGVEGYRQKTPENIVEIARTLLDAGADVDATANVYGGACTTLGLAATSVHPEKAGVQEDLLQLLLDRGAMMDLPKMAGRGNSIIIACLANGRPRAAEYLAARGARLNLAAAAALGRLDVVRSFFRADGSLRRGATRKQMNEGFGYACGYGRKDVIEFLIQRGVDLSTRVGGGQTAMHEAVIRGDVDTVKLLLRYDPPLEVRNIFGGTVFGQAVWSAAHGGDPAAYVEILEALVTAGAKVPVRHASVNEPVDAWMAEHGSAVEPSWSWNGEDDAD